MDLSRFSQISALDTYLENPDHVDIKSIQGDLSLRKFVAGVLTYRPVWVRALSAIRAWQARTMGFEVDLSHVHDKLTGKTLPILSGEKATVFTVLDSDGETYWAAECPESHLKAAICVVAEPLSAYKKMQFHVLTAVCYHNWGGMLEFNLVRPFHHLLVRAAMKSAVREPVVAV